LTVQHQSSAKLREENRALRQQLEQSAELMAANQRLSNLVAQASGRQPMADEQFRELLRLYLDAVEHAGIRVLNNGKVEINGLQIIGVHDAELHAPPLFRALLQGARLDRNRPSILLAHQPLNLLIPEEEGVSLQLSGHTHGGQLWPWTWVAARVHGRFNRGLNQFGKLLVLTSNGAGTWGAPMRVGTKSEIVLIRLAPV
jgi:predicted MPP superfamily phosphohydrolase